MSVHIFLSFPKNRFLKVEIIRDFEYILPTLFQEFYTLPNSLYVPTLMATKCHLQAVMTRLIETWLCTGPHEFPSMAMHVQVTIGLLFW